MFRKRMADPASSEGDTQFVTMLYGLPVVTSAVGQLNSLYTSTKERNRLFRFTLETAESGLGLVVSTAKPIIAKFDKPIGTLNDIACHQLVKLEHDYPIITKPTDEVFKQTMESCASAVKPITTRVDSVKQYSVSKLGDVKSYGLGKVTAVTDLGTKQATRLFENQAGRVIVAKVDDAIKFADSYVEHYLPADGEYEPTAPSTQEKSSKLSSDDNCSQALVASRAMELGRKVRRRAYMRAVKQLRTVRGQSVDTLDCARNKLPALPSFPTLSGTRDKMIAIWSEINMTPEEAANEVTEHEKVGGNLTYERRLIATARHVTQKLKVNLPAGVPFSVEMLTSRLSGVHLSVEMIPAMVRVPAETALQFAFSILERLSQRVRTSGVVSDSDVDRVKSSVGQLRDTVMAWKPVAAIAANSPYRFTKDVKREDRKVPLLLSADKLHTHREENTDHHGLDENSRHHENYEQNHDGNEEENSF